MNSNVDLWNDFTYDKNMYLLLFRSWALPNQQWFDLQKHPKDIIKQHPYDVLSDLFIKEIQQIVPQRTLGFYSYKYQNLTENCINKYDLHHGDDFAIRPTNNVEKKFLYSMFAIETIHCIPNKKPQEVKAYYNSLEFRKTVMPGVDLYSRQAKSETPETRTTSCTQTTGMTGVALPSYYCMQHHIWLASDQSLFVEFSSLTSNKRSSDYQTIYYREETVHFSPYENVDTNGTLIYRYTLMRSQDLGRTGLFFLERTLSYTHQKILEGLQEK